MANLRELVTRFGFKVDQTGVQRFNTVMVGMRRRILALGGILGVGFGTREILRFGRAGAQAEIALRGALADIPGGFERVDKAIATTRESLGKLGQIITPAEGREMAASFFGPFEDVSDETIGAFQTFLRAALKLSLQTGQDVTRVFDAIQQAAVSGTLEPLRQLPGITAETARQFQFVTGTLAKVDPTNVIQLRMNMARVRDAVEEALPKMMKFTGRTTAELLEARRAGTELEEGMQDIGRAALKALKEPLAVLADFVGKLNEGAGAADALQSALSGIKLPPTIESVAKIFGLIEETAADRAARRQVLRTSIELRRIRETEGPEAETAAFRTRLHALVAEGRFREAQALQGLLFRSLPGQSAESPRTDGQERATRKPGLAFGPQRILAPMRPAGNQRLDITVHHEGRVVSFPDLASFLSAFGDIFTQATAEFQSSEQAK